MRLCPIHAAGGYATPLRSFPLRTGSKGGIVSRRTTSLSVSRSRFRRPHRLTSSPPSCRCPVSARGSAVLSIDFPVHLGRQRPRSNPAVPRAPYAPARCGCALRVGADSRLGCVGPDSVSEWAGLVGCRTASPAPPFGRGPHPAQEAGVCLHFGF
jgi:hypothetical protein